MVALVTMVMGTILALAMLQAANAYFLGEDSRTKKRAAADLAQAGLDYAFWQVQYQGQGLPYSANVALTTGSFHVDVTDDGNRDKSTMLITATGTCGSYSYTTKRVTLGPLPYHYAWCESGNVDEGDTYSCTSSTRGMRSNGYIKLDSYSSNITTGLWAGTSFNTHGVTTPQFANTPPIAFPSIDFTAYENIANRIYNYDLGLNWPFWPPQGVTVVYGNVSISGTFNGVYTIVAWGDINITGNLQPGNSSSRIALISNHTIRLQITSYFIQAVMYAHRSDMTGKIEIHGAKTINGSMSADNITTDHSITFNRDSSINLDTMRQLNLPGL